MPEITKNKALITVLVALLLIYIVLYQLYFFANFNGAETFVSETILNLLVILIIALNMIFIVFNYRAIESNKVAWLIYMVVSSGIGSIHYYFKHGRDA